jgi:hypothetical protein
MLRPYPLSPANWRKTELGERLELASGLAAPSFSIVTPAFCLTYYTIHLAKKCNHFVEARPGKIA